MTDPKGATTCLNPSPRSPLSVVRVEQLADLLHGKVFVAVTGGALLLGVEDHYLYRAPHQASPADSYITFSYTEEVDYMIDQLRVARAQMQLLEKRKAGAWDKK